MQDIDWDELRIFLAVARGGSFAAAAATLQVDETTVGRRIARLENRLGAKLLGRTPEGTILTSAGEAVRVSGEEMERAALGLERRAMGADRKLAGRVRVTAPELLGTHFVLPALQPVRERNPEIVVELIPTIARLDIARAESDVAVRVVRPSEPNLVCRRLGAYAMGAYVRRGRPVEALVAFLDPFRPRMRPIEERFPGLPVALRTSSSGAVLEAVRLGLGAGDVPSFVGDLDPELVRAGEPEQLELWLVIHADVQRTARVRAVVRTLTDAFAEAAPLLSGEIRPAATRRTDRRDSRSPTPRRAPASG